MKKFLVLFVSAAMLLSTAAMSLAAATVSGEFKYDMYEDDTNSPNHFAKTELLYGVAGNVSDTVYASAKFLFKHGSSGAKDFSNELDKDTGVVQSTANKWSSEVDEFYVTAKQSWGLAKMGYYEYKFTPDRQELKSAGKHVFPKTDATFEFNVPVGAAFTVDAVVAPYAQIKNKTDDGAYALAVNYKAENWGAKVTHADFANDAFGDLNAIDCYYMINDDMKVFVAAVDYSENKGNGAKYKDGFDPVLGFVWSNIADLKLKASVEYAINPRNENTPGEYDEYVLKAEYTLANNISVTAYHFVVGDGQNQEKLRLKFAF